MEFIIDIFNRYGWGGLAWICLVYVVYQGEIKPWMKKRNGSYISYEIINSKVDKTEFEKHKTEVKDGMDKLWGGIDKVNDNISGLKDIMIAKGAK